MNEVTPSNSGGASDSEVAPGMTGGGPESRERRNFFGAAAGAMVGFTSLAAFLDAIGNETLAAGESAGYKRDLAAFLKEMKSSFPKMDVATGLVKEFDRAVIVRIPFLAHEWSKYTHLNQAKVRSITLCIQRFPDGVVTGSVEVTDGRGPHVHDVMRPKS